MVEKPVNGSFDFHMEVVEVVSVEVRRQDIGEQAELGRFTYDLT